MRRLLDGLYRLNGGLAATSVLAIAVLVCAQVASNVIDAVLDAAGMPSLGLSIPSYAEIAGYLLAAASFLALAPTWRSGGHIRVALVLERLPARHAFRLDLWSHAVVIGLTGFLTWHVVRLGLESWHYGDVSPGLVPVPLWLPQVAMAFGLGALALAQIDSLVELVAGRSGERSRSPEPGRPRAEMPVAR